MHVDVFDHITGFSDHRIATLSTECPVRFLALRSRIQEPRVQFSMMFSEWRDLAVELRDFVGLMRLAISIEIPTQWLHGPPPRKTGP